MHTHTNTYIHTHIHTGVVSIIDFITGVIRFSADVKQEHELYALQDGLDLWRAVLRNLPSMHPPLLQLFPNVVEVLDRDFEHIQVRVFVAFWSLCIYIYIYIYMFI